MNVINIHRRIINQPKENVLELFKTLSTEDDKVLATDKWSPMIMNNGLNVGSTGGHGPIGYFVQHYNPSSAFIEFKFTKPKGFNGIHKFEIIELKNNTTEIKHTIDMTVSGKAFLLWGIAIRWLHDAFIEDAFDKTENHFTTTKKRTEWSTWVKFLRMILKPRKKQGIKMNPVK